MKLLLFAALVLSPVTAVLRAGDFATEMLEATHKLFHPDSTATCFFVRGEEPEGVLYLVTAAHVLEKTKGETAIVVLRKKQEDGSDQRFDYTIPVRKKDKPLWVRHDKEDAAVLRIAEAPHVEVHPLPMSALADEATLTAADLHICSSLFVLTYPERVEANDAGFALARQGIIASQPFLPVAKHPTFYADFTAFSGDSGGPVFVPGNEDHPLVLGIVIAQTRHDETVKSNFEERSIHHPMGLGTVLQAHFIRETIAKAAAAAISE